MVNASNPSDGFSGPCRRRFVPHPPAVGAEGEKTPPALRVKVAAISLVPLEARSGGEHRPPGKSKRFAPLPPVAPKSRWRRRDRFDALASVKIECGQLAPERIYDTAVTPDSGMIHRFQSLARELNLCLAFGFAERVGDEVYNSAVFIDNRGKICGDYHKMIFAEGDDPSRWFNRLGTHSQSLRHAYGRLRPDDLQRPVEPGPGKNPEIRRGRFHPSSRPGAT